jgi:esterase/lipase superfamily enzyme
VVRVNIEYHKWWSSHLGQEMELKVYGHAGKPAVVFPCQGGRFYEWEDFGMTTACSTFLEEGRLQLFTVDSIDNQTWADGGAHPAVRARRHEAYDRYIISEVIPFIRGRRSDTTMKCLTTGSSMGGYHSANFFFRHPDAFDALIAISGVYQLRMFVGDYSDEVVYLNSPLHYLPNLVDAWYLDQYRRSNIIICCGQGPWEEPALADTLALKRILEDKGIPAWVDLWGHDVNHDWPWWLSMLPYFLEALLGKTT